MSGLQCQLSYGPKFLPPSGNLIEEKGGVTKHTLNPPLISTTTNFAHDVACTTVHFLNIQEMCNVKSFFKVPMLYFFENVGVIIFLACFSVKNILFSKRLYELR